MYCGGCGTKNPKESKFCKECGTKIDSGLRPAQLAPDDLTPIPDPLNRDRLKKLLDMAFWHNQVGNLEGAVLACEAALVINPNSTTAHSLLATVFEKKGDDERAIQELGIVVALNPDSEADRTRLDLLQRGVRVKAAEPPPLYRWLPPVFAGGLRSAMPVMGEPGGTEPSPLSRAKISPRVAAFAAAVLVVALGLLSLQPPAKKSAGVNGNRGQAVAITNPVPTVAPNADPSQAAAPSTYGTTLPPPSKTASAAGSVDNGPDPFMDSLKADAYTLLQPKPGAALKPRARGAKGTGKLPGALPALHAVPIDGGSELAPAPVELSPDQRRRIPQHTVVVSDLDGGEQSSDPAPITRQPAPAAPNANDDASAPQATEESHIHISVSDGPSQPRQAPPAPDSSGIQVSAGDSDPADRYQKRALLLQHKGAYRDARIAYEKAIHGYRTQIASGANVESAQRAIQACEIGLQICRQDQP